MASSKAVVLAWVLCLISVRCSNALQDKGCRNLDEKMCMGRSSCLFVGNECVDRYDRLLPKVKAWCPAWSSKSFNCILNPCCDWKWNRCYTESSCGNRTPPPTDSPTPSPTKTPSKAPIRSATSETIPVSTTIREFKEAGHLQLTSFGMDLINDGVKRARGAIEKELLVSVNEAFNSIGASDFVTEVMNNIGEVENKIRNVIRILMEEKDKFGEVVATIDDMFRTRTEALQNHLDGHCFSSDDDDDLRRRLSTNDMKNQLKNQLSGNAGTVKQIGASFLALHDISRRVGNPITMTTSITCSNGTVLHDQVDNGAIAVMVTQSFGSQFEKNGKSISSSLNVGVDAGITIPAGDVKLAARTGLSIEAERNSGSFESMRGIQRMNAAKGRNVQHLSNNTSLNAIGTAGVKVYLPGFTDAMDGWGGFDVTLDIKAISSKFEGVTVHFRHPWYQCKGNNGNEFNNNILNINAWSVAGLSINYFQFNNTEEFKRGIEAFEGFDEVMNDLVNMLDINNWENNADFSISFGPSFIAGMDSTRCDWDIEANLASQPYASTSHIPQCSVLQRTRRNLRDLSHNKVHQAMIDQQPLQPFRVRDNRFLQASNENNNALREIMDVFIELLGDGGLEIPYCVGSCQGENTNSAKAIQGNITIIPTEGCDGIHASATAKEITLANSAYLFLSEIDKSLADTFVSEFSGIGKFGISKPSLALEVTAYPKVKIEVSGSPQLPAVTSDTGDVEKFLIEAFGFLEDTNVALSAEIQALEYFQMRLSISLDAMPIDGTSVSLESLDGNGPSVYINYKINSLPKPKSQILTGGMVIPLKICTSNCNTAGSEEYIYVAGDVSAELTVGEKKTSATIGGTLSMVGTWEKALGIPILHISNAIIGAQFDISKSFPPPPTKLILGANICLGSQVACDEKNAANEDYIEAITYLKINTNAPEENGVISLRSQLTIVPFLKVIGGLSDDINNIMLDLIDLLPEEIKRTGILPYDSTNCPKTNHTAIAAGHVTLNKDCYAYISYAGQTVNIEEVGMEIPKGFSMAGKMNLTNKFEMRAKVYADVLETAQAKFSIDASIKKTELDGILKLGGSYDPSTKNVEGDAVFKADFDVGETKLYINIRGAIAFPFLQSYATVDIQLNKEKFYFNSTLSLFNGLIEPMAHIEWDWAFSNFKFKFTDIPLGHGIVVVEEMSAGISTTGGLHNAQATWTMDVRVPILFSRATLDGNITTQGVSVEGSIELFDGFVDSTASISWRWDMSEFRLDITELLIDFGGLELGLKHLKMEWNQGKLTASASVSALFIEDITGTLSIEGESGGTRISGTISSDLGSISATALIKNGRVQDLEIDVDVNIGEILEAAWEFTKEVINEVKEAVTGELRGLADDLKKAADEVKHLPIIGELVGDGLNFASDALNWGAGAIDDAIDWTVGAIEDVGAEIGSWFDDDPDPLWHIYNISRGGQPLTVSNFLDLISSKTFQALRALLPYFGLYDGQTNIPHPFPGYSSYKLYHLTAKQIRSDIGCLDVWELEVTIEKTVSVYRQVKTTDTWKVTYSTHTQYELCKMQQEVFKAQARIFKPKIDYMKNKANEMKREKEEWHKLLDDDLDNIHPSSTTSGRFKANGTSARRTISGNVEQKSFSSQIDLDLSSAAALENSLENAERGSLKEAMKDSYFTGMPELPSRVRRRMNVNEN